MTRAGFEKVLIAGGILLFVATMVGVLFAFSWLMRASGEIVELSATAEETVFRTRFLNGGAVLVWLMLLGLGLSLGWAAWAVARGGMRRRSRLPLVVGLSAGLAALILFGSWLSEQGEFSVRERITIYDHDRIEVTSIYVLWSTTETMAISDVTGVTYDWTDHTENPPLDSVTIVGRSGDKLKIDGGPAPASWAVGRRVADAAGVRLRCVLNFTYKPDETVWNCTY